MTPEDLDLIYEGFHDDETFARESLTVLDKAGVLGPMELGPAQKKLSALIRRQRERKKPVRIISLKAASLDLDLCGGAVLSRHRPPAWPACARSRAG